VALESLGVGHDRLPREQLLVAGAALSLPSRSVWGNPIDGAARGAHDVNSRSSHRQISV
jgi:hypothetical protein